MAADQASSGPYSPPASSHHVTPRLGGASVANRLKKSLAVTGLSHVQNGTSAGPEHCENGHAHPPEAGGESTPVGSPVELSETEKEIVRLIGQHLKGLGMNETVSALIQESGCKLENQAASRFRDHVLNGKWDMVISDLKPLSQFVNRPENVMEMKFMVLEQKYLELLEIGQVVDALQVLRSDLSPMNYNTERVHHLSSYLMFNNSSQLRNVAGWLGSSPDARSSLLERLQSFIPPSVMLPPRRLETLLRQALELQYSRCSLHNTRLGLSLDPHSLLIDHKCTRVGFPCETRQILTDHCDEVWCALFSHNGRYLATGSKETTVFVWEVDPETKRLRKWRTLEGHQYGAAFFSWSPDDRYLAVVGAEDGPDLWLWNIEV